MGKKWTLHMKKADFQGIARKYGIDQVSARILRNRDITEDEDIRKFLRGTMADIESPYVLKYAEAAAQSLMDAVGDGISIRIIGDYDADGVCASFIYLTALTAVGAECSVSIPHRMKDGYGINEALIDEALEDGCGLILTCDNGIAAYDQVRHAKDLGMYVIVTDHHEVPFSEDEEGNKTYRLPPADIVVDPKREDDESTFKEICGAVVALKVSDILLTECGLSDEEKKELMEPMLEAAAIATVCDVMPLISDNRIIVKEGLKLINNTKSTGLKALINACSLTDKTVNAHTLGFVIGPCINASGRLETASEALDLLTCDDGEEAGEMAIHLKELNDERKALTERGVEDSISIIEEQGLSDDSVLCVYVQGLHESIAGIIAGKVRERYCKPVFVFTDSEDEGIIKGSGRSIEAYNMYEGLTAAGHLLTKFGGHKMAAGLSMKKENFPEFRKLINERAGLSKEDFVEKVYIDVPLPVSYVNIPLIREFESLAPFGVANPQPLFAQKDVEVKFVKFMGKDGKMGMYTVSDGKGSISMKCFMDAHEFNAFLAERGNRCSILYTAQVNEWNGRESAEITLRDYQ